MTDDDDDVDGIPRRTPPPVPIPPLLRDARARDALSALSRQQPSPPAATDDDGGSGFPSSVIGEEEGR